MSYWALVVVFPIVGQILLFTPGLCQTSPVEHCDMIDIIMGRYFHPHPTVCTKYLQCAQNRGGWWYPKPRNCAPGLFWDVRTTSCIVPKTMNNPCANDPCLAGLDFYEAENHCRSYFKCNGLTTEEMLCCKIGEKYDPVSKTCVLDITRECVNDVCTGDPERQKYPCRLTEFKMDNRFYYESVPAFGSSHMVVRNCPTGTSFNENDCGCTEKVPVTFIRGCDPSMALMFTGNQIRDMEFGHYIRNIDVLVRADTGMFSGSPARLIVPRYANMDWRDEFVFYVVFATQNIQQTDAVLLANSGCPDEEPSIKLAVINSNFLQGTIVLEGNERVTVTVPFIPMGYNVAVFVYDGSVLTLVVTRPDQTEARDERNVPDPNNVALRRCALSIGYGTGSNYFRGFIDLVQVLTCN